MLLIAMHTFKDEYIPNQTQEMLFVITNCYFSALRNFNYLFFKTHLFGLLNVHNFLNLEFLFPHSVEFRINTLLLLK